MNWTDVIAILILGVLIVFAIVYSRRHPDCTGDCVSCKTSCAKRKEGDVPNFVKLYRRDHPKTSEMTSGIKTDSVQPDRKKSSN